MSIVTRCVAGFLFGLLVGVVPAAAQTNPAAGSGSSWTDPPVRGSAGPEAPAPIEPRPEPKSVSESKSSNGAKPVAGAVKPERKAVTAATPAERAAAKLGVQPVEASSRASGSSAQARRSVVRPRMVERPLVIARGSARLVERTARHPTRYARPTIRSYAYVQEPRPDGRGYAGTWSRRRMAGWSGLIEENPASRIARARESGYLVMRMRTYAYPDGTFGRRLMPYDGGEWD